MKVIDGNLFREMVVTGAIVLHNNHPEIDALNVFPVPDGDTGTNMSLTFNAGASEIEKIESADIYEVAKKLSKGLLMGARGNSGVILSQIFRGVSMAFEGKKEVNAVELAAAFKNGAKVAYKAVMRPVEGTILTVIREASDAVVKYAKDDMEIEDVFSYFVKEAELSLERTPELLPVLKEVGVVDSGGAGLLLVFTGFMAALAGEEIEKVEIKGDSTKEALVDVETDSEEGYGYCTEFIFRLDPGKIKAFKEESLRNELERLPGNSIVVVQDEDIVKVHVHTLKPGNALNVAQRYGEFIKLKIENMQEQHNTILEANATPTAQATPVIPQREAKEVAIISVAAGEGIKDMFLELHCDYVVSGGQTMNPSTEDIVQAIRDVNAKHVIILPNNSNIVMTAQQAAVILEDEVDVKVIPSKTIPQGLSACIMYNPEVSLDENIEEMSEAIANVKTGEVTFAIKDTNIDGVDIKANQYMALCGKSITACVPNKLDALKETLKGLVDEDAEIITLIYGEDVTDDEVSEIEEYVEENFDAELECVNGKQPVYSFIVGVE
ncbi:DAK2 domain-containing protein [Candidatus Stoquefichus massiliensis]|uniref:DAK2 domain-containing protein n=1 Tax=Candidatus Stoquefichus massiliensis TaxID=1470350 RepID=UPI00048025E5|nr:DAK2 domain-containing protein [Candidatus Stoquefichus massiliensis]